MKSVSMPLKWKIKILRLQGKICLVKRDMNGKKGVVLIFFLDKKGA